MISKLGPADAIVSVTQAPLHFGIVFAVVLQRGDEGDGQWVCYEFDYVRCIATRVFANDAGDDLGALMECVTKEIDKFRD